MEGENSGRTTCWVTEAVIVGRDTALEQSGQKAFKKKSTRLCNIPFLAICLAVI